MSNKQPQLTPEEKRILRESFISAFGQNGSEKREQACQEMANGMGALLQQEYKMHEGRMWLWTLGKPARPLTEEELNEKA